MLLQNWNQLLGQPDGSASCSVMKLLFLNVVSLKSCVSTQGWELSSIPAWPAVIYIFAGPSQEMSESASFLTKSTKTFIPCKCQFNISNAEKGLELCSFILLNYSLEETVAPQVKITIPRETKRKCNRVRRFFQHPVIILFNPLVKQRHYFANKGPSNQSYDFSSSHVWMWELDCEESWAPKNWCFWTVVLEKTLESPLGCKEIQPVHPEGDQSWVFIGRTDAEGETPIFWPPHAKSWFIGKDPDAGRDWGQEEKGTTEDEMAGWHHRHNGHEFE